VRLSVFSINHSTVHFDESFLLNPSQ